MGLKPAAIPRNESAFGRSVGAGAACDSGVGSEGKALHSVGRSSRATCPRPRSRRFPARRAGGMYSFGGRGGRVFVVNRLEDRGPERFVKHSRRGTADRGIQRRWHYSIKGAHSRSRAPNITDRRGYRAGGRGLYCRRHGRARYARCGHPVTCVFAGEPPGWVTVTTRLAETRSATS